MNLKANATFRAGDFARLEAVLVPKLIAGATVATDAVFAISQERVPVDTGELKASGSTSVAWEGHRVNGYITYSAGHAAYAEFGVRSRGAAGEWAGPFAYSGGTGYAGFGYMRGSLDIGRPQVLAAFKEALAV